MKSNIENKLLLLKDQSGQALRVIHARSSTLVLAKNNETKRVELLEPKVDIKESHTFLQEVDVSPMRLPGSSIHLKNIGSLSLLNNDGFSRLDPQVLVDDEAHFPIMVKWSSGFHGTIVGLLVLLAFLMPKQKNVSTEKVESLVTIQLNPTTPKLQPVVASPKPELIEKNKVSQKIVKSVPVSKRKIVPSKIHVSPRTNKQKSLLVRNKTSIQKTSSNNRKLANGNTNKIGQFQRLGTLGALTNAIKGVQSGMGSGLRPHGGGAGGGVGRGAGGGRGNGTMGHGRDSGGGYEQALYGKGLIAGQVGAGGGGFGSGWGNGTAGAGGYGTKGKGGGHEGYGNSKVGSGATQFSYPVSDEAVVEGGLDREAVDLVITKNLGQIIYCYELGLQQKSQLRGRVAVDFTINGQGKVSSCSVNSSSLRSDKVESCIVSKIKTWKFPRPVGGVNVDVNYPFALQRVSQN